MFVLLFRSHHRSSSLSCPAGPWRYSIQFLFLPLPSLPSYVQQTPLSYTPILQTRIRKHNLYTEGQRSFHFHNAEMILIKGVKKNYYYFYYRDMYQKIWLIVIFLKTKLYLFTFVWYSVYVSYMSSVSV